MKKLFGIGLFFLFLAIAPSADAQSKAKKAGHEVKKGAQKAGKKTAEVASKGKAKITDEVYKDKVAPNGETVYIDNHSRYYWVDKKGKRHYINEAALINRNKND